MVRFHSILIKRMGTSISCHNIQSCVKCYATDNNPVTPAALITSTEFYRRPLPRLCIPFSSPEGKRLFRDALLDGHMESYFSLAAQLCTQDEPAYCGLATLVMVLNAFEMDPGRVWKKPWRWYHESMLKCCTPSDILTEGIVMDKFVEIATCHGLNVEMHRVHDSDDPSEFRSLVDRMTQNDSEGFLVSCFSRRSLGQTGTGHFAPIGGYHRDRDLVFLFDTARFKYPSHWVPISHLWDGMSQVDPATGKPRGYMILTRSAQMHLLGAKNERSPQGDRPSSILFDFTDCASQAYMSPSALCDTYSSGYRLRLVSDQWNEWLLYTMDTPCSSEELLLQAVEFLLKLCGQHAPRNFFLTIKPVPQSSANSDSVDVRRLHHEVIQDLILSPIGQSIRKALDILPTELFTWFTTQGTFQSPVRPSDSHSLNPCDSLNSSPFAELQEPRLRMSLLLLGFLSSYPYNEVQSANSSPADQHRRVVHLGRLIEEMPFSKNTLSELDALKTILWSLQTSSIRLDEAFSLCCGQDTKRYEQLCKSSTCPCN